MAVRTDAENLKVLEGVRGTYDRLTQLRIRNEADLERCERDYAEARQRAEESFGTSDETELRRMIEERRAENQEAVDAFAQSVRAVEAQLSELDRRTA